MTEPEDLTPKERATVEAEAAKEAADLEVEQTEPVDTVAIKETT